MLRKTTPDRFGESRSYAADSAGDFSGTSFDIGPANRPGTSDSSDNERELNPRDNRNQSTIDASSSFNGRFEAGQDLVILGTLSGEVVCKGLVTIERDATAKARIETNDATIRGRLDGDISCAGRLVIASTAQVTGTFKAGALVVEEGASIRGDVETANAAIVGETPSGNAKGARKGGNESTEAGNGAGSGRWSSRNRDVPSFALVANEERNAGEN